MLRRALRAPEDDVFVFRGADRVEVLVPLGEDGLRIEELDPETDELVRVLELSR